MRKLVLVLPLILAACATSATLEPQLAGLDALAAYGEVDDIYDRIETAREHGVISKRQARLLRKEAAMIGGMADRYARDGLSEAEARELENRSLYLRDAVLAPGHHSATDRPEPKRP